MKKLTEQYIESLGSDSQLVFGGTFEGGYHIQQIPDEITPCINDIINSKVKIENFLDIGSAAGGSTFLFNEVFNLKHIVIIDDNQHPKHVHRARVIKTIKKELIRKMGSITEVIGNSHDEEVVKAIRQLKRKYDVILLDAGHDYDDILMDEKNYGGLLNSGGFLIVHDVEIFDSARLAFDKISKMKRYKDSKKYISKTHTPCGIGVLRK